MKQTNDKAIIRLVHLPTGKEVDWLVSPKVTPAVHFIDERANRKRKELAAYLDEHNIDLDNDKKVPVEHLEVIASITAEMLQLRMNALSVVLAPKVALPEGITKREYLEECISSYEMINELMGFFSKHSTSSSDLPADFPKMQILDSAGNPWQNSNVTKK